MGGACVAGGVVAVDWREDERLLDAAAKAIACADGLVIGAGAGMGVDSGLPDFRGVMGFWRCYPPLARLGLAFEDIAQPRWFRSDPEVAWGFYGHRLALYRRCDPHPGYGILLRWARSKPAGYFVFTSNVDGHFARAGFEETRLVECHGSIEFIQCVEPCSPAIYPTPAEGIAVDEATLRARPPLPACPACGRLARPNILMFCDWDWIARRTESQRRRLDAWLNELAGAKARLAIVEIGAGPAVATVRWTCESLARGWPAPLVRINPRHPEGPPGTISLAGQALEILRALDARVASLMRT